MYSFCDIPTYEGITGTVVPVEDQEHVQAILDLNSDLAGLYMGEPCATRAAAEWPDLLAGLVSYRTYRGQTIPAGVQSESVGSSSVSYVPSQTNPMGLLGAETMALDLLCGRNTYGRGIGSVSFAGKAFINTAPPAQTREAVATALGWPTTWRGWAYVNHPESVRAMTDRSEFYADE
jgi:hypothetical protein